MVLSGVCFNASIRSSDTLIQYRPPPIRTNLPTCLRFSGCAVEKRRYRIRTVSQPDFPPVARIAPAAKGRVFSHLVIVHCVTERRRSSRRRPFSRASTTRRAQSGTTFTTRTIGERRTYCGISYLRPASESQGRTLHIYESIRKRDTKR